MFRSTLNREALTRQEHHSAATSRTTTPMSLIPPPFRRLSPFSCLTVVIRWLAYGNEGLLSLPTVSTNSSQILASHPSSCVESVDSDVCQVLGLDVQDHPLQRCAAWSSDVKSGIALEGLQMG